MGESPAFAQLSHKMGSELLGCQGESLSLVGRNISPNEKAGGADNFGIGHEHRTAARLKFVSYVHGEVKLRRGKDVAAHRSRRGTSDFGDLSLEDGINITLVGDLVITFVLQVLDIAISN